MTGYRIQRIQRILLEELAYLVHTQQLRDPRIGKFTVFPYATVAEDLSSATISVSGYDSKQKLEHTVQALNHAQGYIRTFIGKKHSWKHSPKLIFKITHSIEDGSALIRKIEKLSSSEHSSSQSQTVPNVVSDVPQE